MNKGIKIFIGVVVMLGILSGIFLLFAKKNSSTTPEQTSQVQKKVVPEVKNSTVLPSNNSQAQQDGSMRNQDGLPQAAAPQKAKPKAKTDDRKALAGSEWTQCKNKTMPTDKGLFWSLNITEAIPAGGTYAKGNLNGDSAFPVRVIIKPDSQIAEKIKGMLVVGKMALLRGNCTDVAVDGTVVLQAF